MIWIQNNSIQIGAGLVAAGFLCGAIGPFLPPGRLQNAVLAAAHLLPGDLLRAVQALARVPS
jgi:hypothetical protein